MSRSWRGSDGEPVAGGGAAVDVRMIEGSAAAPGDRDLSRLSVRTLPDGAGLAVWRSEDRARVLGRPGGGEGAAVARCAPGEDRTASRLPVAENLYVVKAW